VTEGFWIATSDGTIFIEKDASLLQLCGGEEGCRHLYATPKDERYTKCPKCGLMNYTQDCEMKLSAGEEIRRN
jgi:hypothetical protein